MFSDKAETKIRLSDHFTYTRLIRFVFPSIVMMLFTSVYGMVDGYFVSNFVGKTPFSAVNLMQPAFMMVGAIGMMIGAGGGAVIGKTLGEGRNHEAKQYFTFLVAFVLLIGVITSFVCWFFVDRIALLLGADGPMLEDCVTYGKVLLISMPLFILHFSMETLFVTAERPKLGLAITIGGGVTNIVLDALFIIVFGWGLKGAAIATAIAQILSTGTSLVYFSVRNSSLLRFTHIHFADNARVYGRILLKSITNGSSEMVGNIAYSLVCMLYNVQLMKYYGEDGVAAYGVLMYIGFVFASIFIGYSIGTSPPVSFNYGALNHDELKNLFKKSMILIGIAGCVMLALALIFADPLSRVFVGYDAELNKLTHHALMIYSWTFLIMGFSLWGSAFFTALNNGVVSAIIAMLRTFLFEIGSIFLLPVLFPKDGLWFAPIVSEISAVTLTLCFMIAMRKRYHYL